MDSPHPPLVSSTCWQFGARRVLRRASFYCQTDLIVGATSDDAVKVGRVRGCLRHHVSADERPVEAEFEIDQLAVEGWPAVFGRLPVADPDPDEAVGEA